MVHFQHFNYRFLVVVAFILETFPFPFPSNFEELEIYVFSVCNFKIRLLSIQFVRNNLFFFVRCALCSDRKSLCWLTQANVHSICDARLCHFRKIIIISSNLELYFTLLHSFGCFSICLFRSPFGIVGSAHSKIFHRCVHCSLLFPLFKVYSIKVLWSQKTLASKHEFCNSINSWMRHFMTQTQ